MHSCDKYEDIVEKNTASLNELRSLSDAKAYPIFEVIP